MACTTILVGRLASNDNSTIIARNDDCPSGQFTEKKLIIKEKNTMGETYTSKISKVCVKLPKESLKYTLFPSVNDKSGLWPAAGINELNVGMSATETITSNPRVLGADPYVKLHIENDEEIPGGIGEEDLVALVLPYIKSAREGVLRLGKLLEEYGTYEPNGIAFNDDKEVWWLETIGGHHFIARRVPDDRYVVMPNQFGLDNFDLEDAFGEQKDNICSKDLKEFIKKFHLDLNQNDVFNPRLIFGSYSDSDHVYNTPRAWDIERNFNKLSFKWYGDNADYTPESDNLPWSLVPDHKLSVEDVKYALSLHFQGTEYDPYSKGASKLIYRTIGINRTSLLNMVQIRNGVEENKKAILWFTFGSNVFNQIVPFMIHGNNVPSYYENTTLELDSNNFYWANRLIGALADAHYGSCLIHIERYQNALANKAHELINLVDFANYPLDDFNKEMADEAQKLTRDCLEKVLYTSSMNMKNAFQRSDN
jgi:dipeptidase